MRRLLERLEEGRWHGKVYDKYGTRGKYGGGYYDGEVYPYDEVPSDIVFLSMDYPKESPGRDWEWEDDVGWYRISHRRKQIAAQRQAAEKKPPSAEDAVEAEARKMLTVLNRTKSDPVIAAVIDKMFKSNISVIDWKKAASEDDLKKVRHALYKRGMKSDANIFR
jgi:hypothetical protein